MCTAQQFVAYGNMSGHTEAIFEFQPLTPDITPEKVIFAKFFTLKKNNIIRHRRCHRHRLESSTRSKALKKVLLSQDIHV